MTPSAPVIRSPSFSRKPKARVSQSIALAASSYAMNGTIVWAISASVGGLVPALEALTQVAQETSGERTVDEPVVVREREVHDRPDRDHVLAELVLHDPRAFHDRVGAENPRLRLADHRRAMEGPVAAGIRDRERASLDFVRRQLLVPCTLCDLRDAPRDPKQVQPFGVAQDGNDQPLAVLQL